MLLFLVRCDKEEMKLFNKNSEGTDFYIIAGQSNCGRSTVSEMSGGEAAVYDVNFANTKILDFVNGDWEQINPGTNTQLANASAADEFGPEVSLSKRLQDSRAADTYILKYARGSTSLAVSWASGSTDRNNLKAYMEDAIQAAQTEGKNLNLKGFIWMQGEEDATNLTWANDYQTNLTALFVDLRNHWANLVSTYSLKTPENFKVIIGRINGASDPSEVYRTTVRTAQANYCNTAANWAVLIDTDSYPLKDAVHYSATGQISFGLDIFKAL
jgi:hypothetical protein